MRKILILLTLVLFCSWLNPGYAEDLKVGFINLKNVLDKYQKVQNREEQLLKEAEAKNKERDKLVKEVKKLREKIELLKDKQKEKKQKELDRKIKELQDFTYQTRTNLRQARDEKFREIMKEVKEVIEEYGQSRNFNAIIDDTLILYKDTKLDVTTDVIKMLNQRYR